MHHTLYSYPQSNDTLISSLKLQPHPEGGHFAVTYPSTDNVSSPYAESKADRSVQSTIYYLLSMNEDVPDNEKEGVERIRNHSSSIGIMHKNKSTTMHLHHSGRVIYTLISTTKPVQIRNVIMGEDYKRGEVRQLVVDGSWWKVSEIPLPDRESVERGEVDASYVGGLISEVVTPGFDWADHEYMTEAKLQQLLQDDQDAFHTYKKYCRE